MRIEIDGALDDGNPLLPVAGVGEERADVPHGGGVQGIERRDALGGDVQSLEVTIEEMPDRQCPPPALAGRVEIDRAPDEIVAAILAALPKPSAGHPPVGPAPGSRSSST